MCQQRNALINKDGIVAEGCHKAQLEHMNEEARKNSFHLEQVKWVLNVIVFFNLTKAHAHLQAFEKLRKRHLLVLQQVSALLYGLTDDEIDDFDLEVLLDLTERSAKGEKISLPTTVPSSKSGRLTSADAKHVGVLEKKEF